MPSFRDMKMRDARDILKPRKDPGRPNPLLQIGDKILLWTDSCRTPFTLPSVSVQAEAEGSAWRPRSTSDYR